MIRIVFAGAVMAFAMPVFGQEKPASAANLRVRVAASNAEAKDLLDAKASAWNAAEPINVLLSRTPRVYQTEPTAPRTAPKFEVRAIRSGGNLFVRLQWEDATKNAPQAPAKKSGEGGDAEKIYKRPTGETSSFPDVVALMVPQEPKGAFPSLAMGDKNNPTRIFYWNASRGTQELTSTGRAMQKPAGRDFPHRADHADGKWTVVLQLPNQPDGCPVAFAVWDGEHQDRDGLKFFSIWYVLTDK
jgi:hypothetical protein